MSRCDPRVYRLAGAVLGVLLVAGVLVAIAASSGSSGGGSRWSTPATLSSCTVSGSPAIAFPSSSPTHRTGPGAIVWSAGRACAHGPSIRIVALGSSDHPLGARTLPAPPSGTPVPDEETGAGEGRVLLATGWLLREWAPSGALGPTLAAAPGGPMALATAYRGEAVALYVPRALAAADPGNALVLRREPYRDTDDASTTIVSAGAREAIGVTAAALDYRTDAIAVWRQGEYLYARSLPHAGPPAPIHRLAPAGEHPQLTVLISDDGRAIIAWSERDDEQTSIYAEITSPGIRFVAPRLLGRYRDPAGVPPPEGSLRLTRLSNGRVLLAWPGASDDRYVMRLAHVAVSGVQRPRTIAARTSGEGAVLADLVPGPREDALLLWKAVRPGTDEQLRAQSIFASYAMLSSSGTPLLGGPELVSATGAAAGPNAAFDQNSDRAVAVWRTSEGGVAYAVREAGGTTTAGSD